MIWWQQCNLCNGSNVETAVFRRNSWKTNYIIALLEMKALSLIWSYLGRSQQCSDLYLFLFILYWHLKHLDIYHFSFLCWKHWHELITNNRAALCNLIRGVRHTGLYIYFILPSSYFLLLKGNETIYFFSIGKPVNLLLVPRI